jgi:hypothetical protein
MKIGFSFGRCVRDIVNGDVDIDDVAFIITATHINSEEQLDGVIRAYLYEPNYLLGYDADECIEVAKALWNSSRVLQPRRQGMHRHMQPENAVWVDMFPTALSENDNVKNAWEAYRFMLHMVENVENEAMDAFKQ